MEESNHAVFEAHADDSASGFAPPMLISSRPLMPPEIASAIVAVMAKITLLTKDTENKFQKYKYVSVDQFYDLIGHLMADEGIFTMLYEKSMAVGERTTTDDYGKTKTSVWLSAVYDVWIYHKSGISFGPVERSITVLASGAQSYAAAISFVSKYFLRTLFMIPTGDADADADEKRDLPTTTVRQERRAAEPKEPTALFGAEQAKLYLIGQATRAWKTFETRAQLREWWRDRRDAMGNVFDGAADPLYIELKEKFQARAQELPETEAS